MSDNVNHPKHYASGGIECIDAMEAAFGKAEVASFCKLNAFKYIWRCFRKEDGVEEAIVCHYSENEISPKIIKKLGFKHRDSIISEVSMKEIKCYTKKI